MREEREVILLRIDRKSGLFMLATTLMVLGGLAVGEQLTLTTSYPVPSGIYNQLITTGNSVSGVNADTTLNRNAGNTILVPNASNPKGRVGIGTTSPAAALDVNGAVNTNNTVTVGNFPTASAPVGQPGGIYYDTTLNTMMGFQGSPGKWSKFGGTNPPTLSWWPTGTYGAYLIVFKGAYSTSITSCSVELTSGKKTVWKPMNQTPPMGCQLLIGATPVIGASVTQDGVTYTW